MALYLMDYTVKCTKCPSKKSVMTMTLPILFYALLF